uniref:Transglutaminase family protein n=1 Tax=uncultured Chloroflexota bacterium TaxID=166587 RepID=H5SK96_9CHLR|nr:transglutaminase domain protein [uncultured bacterium]BAL56582.1 transglutaminase family protein [uncultured Chloroflexota bacterium]
MKLWTKAPAFTWDLPSALFLFGLLLSVTIRANLTGWTEDLVYLPAIVVLSSLLGLLLGVSRFRHIGLTLLISGYSFIGLAWFFLQLEASSFPLSERLISTSLRLQRNLLAFAHREALGDAFLFIVLGYLLGWMLGLWCGFVLIRHNQSWAVLIPPSLLLTALYLYDPLHPASTTLWAYLTFAALLVARRYALQNQRQWKAHGTLVHSEAMHDLTSSALRVTLFALALAWLIPWALSPSSPVQKAWERLRKAWEPAQERLSEIVEPLRGQGGQGATHRRLALGLESARGEAILFIAETPPEAPVLRYYWREQVFDHFDGNVWTVSPEEQVPISSGQDLPVLLPRRGRELQISFQLFRPSSWIYTFAAPKNVDVEAQLSGFRISDASLDLLSLQASRRFDKGERYTLLTRVASPSSDDLREAEGALPRWVLDRYLQLPADFSPRLRALAETITRGMTTRYEKAEAITAYLRQQIAYAARIPPPPPGKDVMEWFLFEHRQGFCNYYASAEVLLLRAVGVPARLAVGYAQGESRDGGRYLVRERHAHAWPEVYFPGWGWVEFEPTASQQILVRPPRADSPPSPKGTIRPAQRRPSPRLPEEAEKLPATASGKEARSWLWLLFGGGSAILLTLLAKRYARKGNFPLYLENALMRYGLEAPPWLERWARWDALSPVEKAFEEINRALRHLGLRLPPSATPAERAAHLAEILPEVQPAIEELLQAYQKVIYGKGPGHSQRAQRAAMSIRRAVWRKTLHFKPKNP